MVMPPGTFSQIWLLILPNMVDCYPEQYKQIYIYIYINRNLKPVTDTGDTEAVMHVMVLIAYACDGPTSSYTNDRIPRYTKNTSAYLPPDGPAPSANLPPLREFEKCVFASSCYQANYETRIGLATIMGMDPPVDFDVLPSAQPSAYLPR
jgi:hypothetical protein